MADQKFSTPTRAASSPAQPLPESCKKNGIRISMDGRGRCQDNIFVERLWWTVKYHYLHLHEFTDGIRLRQGLVGWFNYYNRERCHQALDDRTPDEVYSDEEPLKEAA